VRQGFRDRDTFPWGSSSLGLPMGYMKRVRLELHGAPVGQLGPEDVSPRAASSDLAGAMPWASHPQPSRVLRAAWPPPGHKAKPGCMTASHLQPAGVEEELQEGGERDIHIQVPFLPGLQRLQELPSNEAEGEEGVDSNGNHLPGAWVSRQRV